MIEVKEVYGGEIVSIDSNDELYVGTGVINSDGFMSREDAEESGNTNATIEEAIEALKSGVGVVAVNGGDNDEFFEVRLVNDEA